MEVATLGGVLALGRSIVQVASDIQDLTDEWLTVTEEYELKVDSLRIKIEFYGEEMSKHGVPVDHSMVKTLQRAKEWLIIEELKVKQLAESINSSHCCAIGWWLYAKVTMITFPQKLAKTIKRVTDEIDKITTNLKMEAELADHLRKWRESEAIPTTVHNNDGLYVPIKESQLRVENAIDKFSRKARIVLLHGGVGKGKSTLAKYVCALYGKRGKKGNLFEHVILVSCGNCSIPDPLKKQFEILKLLSGNSFSGSLQRGESDSEARILVALQYFLSSKRILIILDDVSDQSFLHKMWEASQDADHVKYFITSRRSDLCSSLTASSLVIKMGKPTPNEAREILVTHAGFEETNIPNHLKVIAEEMIKATEANPLALACLTCNFTNDQDRKNIRAWQEALYALYNLLDKPESKIVFGQRHETPWASMRLCIDSLDTERAGDGAYIILLLMYACRGQSIPEEVLRLLYSEAMKKIQERTGEKKPSETFFKSIAELSTRDLLNPSPSTLALGKDQTDEYLQESRAWSLRSLVKLYMDWDMTGKADNEEWRSEIVSEGGSRLKMRLRSVILDLLGDDAVASEAGRVKGKSESQTEGVNSENTRLIAALCALYFDPASTRTPLSFDPAHPYTDEVVASAAHLACTVSNLIDSNDSTSKLRRRKAIEPIIWLLDQLQADDDKSKGLLHRVRPVFLKYVCEGQLDDDSICNLLRGTAYLPVPLATLTAIAYIFSKEERRLLDTNRLTYVKVILHLLEPDEGVRRSIREAASEALLHISKKAVKEQLTSVVMNTPRILAVLVRSIHDSLAKNAGVNSMESLENNPLLLQNTKGALMQGAVGGKSIKRLGLPAGKQSIQHRKRRQILAAGGESTELRTSDEDGTLLGLDSMVNNPILLQNIVGTLMNLAAGGESIKQQISNEEGALSALVKCLSQDHNPSLQEHAVGAFMNLALGGNPIKSQILDEDGALAGLVNCLSKLYNPSLQERAAAALRDLAYGGDSFALKIANEKGALANLVKSLSKDQNPRLQGNSAGALGNLASGEEKIKLRILDEDGALAGLVNSLSNHHNPILQEKAAGTLSNLATVGDSSKPRILIQDGAIAGLVDSLSIHNNPVLQQSAAGALLNLAGGGDSIKLQILKEERVLASLVESLSEEHNLSLQEKAAGALSNLARGGDSIKSKIVNESEALAGLVKLLSKDHNLAIPENAAGALLNLAAGAESIKWQILNEDGALTGLIKALCKDQNPGLQENAIGALMNLALGGEKIKLHILNIDMAFGPLLESLSEHHNPIVQRYAIGALSCLAGIKGYSIMSDMSPQGPLEDFEGTHQLPGILTQKDLIVRTLSPGKRAWVTISPSPEEPSEDLLEEG